jgi:NADP-dependent 3-hydroxy acid dehydrogenase YdfG
MTDTIAGAVVVITGVGSGPGGRQARRVAAEGATVVLGARPTDRI